MLELREVQAGYGRVAALHRVSLRVDQGELVTLIGVNGAGKSTVIKTVVGLLTPSAGGIWFKGQEITALPPHERVRRGIAISPEGRRIFPRMTVLENLEVGGFTLRVGGDVACELRRVFELFPRLYERRMQRAGSLSGGEQQMLAIARALMARPALLLLDEPSLGLGPIIVERIAEVIQTLKQAGFSILLVEQNAHMALSLADRGYVLETGRMILQGSATELRDDPKVREVYLGRVAGKLARGPASG